jgi:hypothetical protein
MIAVPKFMSNRPERERIIDAPASLLKTVHLGGSLYFRSELGALWGMEVPPSREAQFHLVRRGRCWLLQAYEGSFAPLELESCVIVVLPHRTAYIQADDPETPILPLKELLSCDLRRPTDICLPSSPFGQGQALI